MIEVLGYFLALFIGFSLGLLGGGGSILTVPILVYVLAVEPILATGYSLFVVGTTASVGAVKKYRQGLVHIQAALLFGIPSLLAVFATRRFVLPAIPETLFTLHSFTLTKAVAIMVLFAILMLMAAIRMIRAVPPKTTIDKKQNTGVTLIYGIVIGCITALVGAGGGFLIVPALVLLLKLPVKSAIGTSLLIIAINSGVGFIGDLSAGQSISWSFLLSFTSVSMIGMFIGIYTTNFVKGENLKQAFGWFVLIMALLILIMEITG